MVKSSSQYIFVSFADFGEFFFPFDFQSKKPSRKIDVVVDYPRVTQKFCRMKGYFFFQAFNENYSENARIHRTPQRNFIYFSFQLINCFFFLQLFVWNRITHANPMSALKRRNKKQEYTLDKIVICFKEEYIDKLSSFHMLIKCKHRLNGIFDFMPYFKL